METPKILFSRSRCRRINLGSVVLPGFILIAIFGFSQQLYAQPEAAGAAIMAIEEKPLSGTGRAESSTAQAQGKSGTSHLPAANQGQRTKNGSQKAPVSNSSTKRPTTTATNPAKYDGFIVGDKYSFLNFEIASKVQPIWTLKAKNAGASGLVQVEVYIDQNGNVLTARARTGNVLLHPEAERAALATKFNKPYLYNKPVRAMGFVVYRFGKAEDDD